MDWWTVSSSGPVQFVGLADPLPEPAAQAGLRLLGPPGSCGGPFPLF